MLALKWRTIAYFSKNKKIEVSVMIETRRKTGSTNASRFIEEVSIEKDQKQSEKTLNDQDSKMKSI